MLAGGIVESVILEKAEYSDVEWKEIIHNHKILTRVFLSDILTIIGKYFFYYESKLP